MKDIKKALRTYWGYKSFLPLQSEAMECVVSSRDSVVVLPTGGGKSLCYQAPAVILSGMALVISPLISLMKDQVDALSECGIPSARIDSTLTNEGKTQILDSTQRGEIKVLYVSPERMAMDTFIDFLKGCKISLIAIDEAHCISMWGHDFRPEYRRLGELKNLFPGISIHSYTATATEQVRNDIVAQLRLENPTMIVGSFDRPNLTYKTERRQNRIAQISSLLDRHPNESGIIYCIRRDDVDSLVAALSSKGYSVLPYHAGMGDEDRKKNQDAFMKESVLTIVATIAFGMGIDKSNVRYVVHEGMPKSIENYQQESGRAGRDGLEAECCLFYSGSDFMIWKRLLQNMDSEAKAHALNKLNDMYNYCTGVSCRRKVLLNYFGQEMDRESCEGCDVCLGHITILEEALVTAQKILSCIVRLDQRFGADYTASVLLGSKEARILENNHDSLSTYGLLSGSGRPTVRDWIGQLVSQEYIHKTEEFNILKVTEKGWRVLNGSETPLLLKPATKPARVSKIAAQSWEDVDIDLFHILKQVRHDIATKKKRPAFIIFSDAALRDMARLKPRTPDDFLQVKGVGEKKCEQYSSIFLSAINRDNA